MAELVPPPIAWSLRHAVHPADAVLSVPRRSLPIVRSWRLPDIQAARVGFVFTRGARFVGPDVETVIGGRQSAGALALRRLVSFMNQPRWAPAPRRRRGSIDEGRRTGDE